MRFPGFTDDWEQRKLSSLCDKFTDGDWIESKDQSDSGVRLVQTGNVGVAEYLNKPNNKKWISEETFDRLHCEEVLPGDILISRLPEPAGRACIMPFLGSKMITAVDCTIVRTSPYVSNKFLVQYLSSQAYFDEVNTCLAGGTRQRISRSNLAEFNVPIPSEKDEQDAIGDFFSDLDNLITLHQRKFNQMKKYRQGMLQKLFPKAGEKAPEVRFPGFEGEWEEWDMGSLYVERKEPGNDSLHILSVSIHTGISDGELDDSVLGKTVRRSEDKSTYKHVYEGDLVYNMMRAWQGAIGVTRNEGMVSPAYITAIPNEKVFPRFMNVTLRRPDIISQINNLSYGVTDFRKRLYWDSFVQVKCMLPSLEEQRAIAGTFEKYDNMIALQALLLEEIKEYKKGLLQQMFV